MGAEYTVHSLRWQDIEVIVIGEKAISTRHILGGELKLNMEVKGTALKPIFITKEGNMGDTEKGKSMEVGRQERKVLYEHQHQKILWMRSYKLLHSPILI